ncbi:MAG: ABC transporter permease, partial [Chloroflexota bacterium]|nr:ABC transporter permease [Chloroflexota bacterium]
MEQFFDWPVARVALGLGITVGVLICAFAILGWRAPLLFKLGTRNTARRMLRAALIVFGLMLSTTVVGSAFGTGDTMAQTVRSLVAGSLGTVDEVVVLNPPRMSRTERLRALTEPGLGTLAAVDLDFFPEAESARIAAMMRGSKAIAGIVPAITDQVTVVHRASQQLRSAVALLAVPAPFPSAFGPLETADGAPIALQSLEPDEVVLNAAAAESLGAAAGQPLQLLVDGNPWDTRIRAVASNGSFVGTQPLLIVPLTHYQHVVHREGQINQLLVANHGGTDSVARSEEATLDLRQALVDRSAAQQLHDLLARPDVQHGLREAEGSLQGRQRER